MSDLDTFLSILGFIVFMGWFISATGSPDDHDDYLGSP